MSRVSRRRGLALWPVLLALLPLACSRPANIAQADPHRIPFKDGQSTSGDGRAGDSSSATNLTPDSDLPFDDSQGLPAGTLVTVRLKNAIASDNPGFSGIFDAVVDEAILENGTTLLPRGAGAAGRVEAARASELKRNRSYVRLTLNSIHLAGRDLPVHTSSLFVHGNASEPAAPEGATSPQIVRLESGRRLTFRLTEPVPIFSSANNFVR